MGSCIAEFYLIRPEADCEAHPLESIVSVSSGTEGTFGGWRGPALGHLTCGT